jgi:hypothetical protein
LCVLWREVDEGEVVVLGKTENDAVSLSPRV